MTRHSDMLLALRTHIDLCRISPVEKLTVFVQAMYCPDADSAKPTLMVIGCVANIPQIKRLRRSWPWEKSNHDWLCKAPRRLVSSVTSEMNCPTRVST